MWGKDNYILPGNGYSCHGIHSLHSFPPLAVRRIVTLLQTEWSSIFIFPLMVDQPTFSSNIFHFRLDQASSLLVDNGDTVTARSPGYLTQLNTEPVLYLGKLFLLKLSANCHLFCAVEKSPFLLLQAVTKINFWFTSTFSLYSCNSMQVISLL